MKKIAALYIIILLVSACHSDNNCANVFPPPNYFEISFTDGLGNTLLGSTYTQDSFRLYNGSVEMYIKPQAFGDPTHLQIFYPDLLSGMEYYLELDSLDTDTANFTFTMDEQECFTDYSMTSFIYNGTAVSATSGVYSIEK